MSVNTRTIEGKWQVNAAGIGGSTLLGEHDSQGEATDQAINYKADNPADWVYVSQNTFVIVDEA